RGAHECQSLRRRSAAAGGRAAHALKQEDPLIREDAVPREGGRIRARIAGEVPEEDPEPPPGAPRRDASLAGEGLDLVANAPRSLGRDRQDPERRLDVPFRSA